MGTYIQVFCAEKECVFNLRTLQLFGTILLMVALVKAKRLL